MYIFIKPCAVHKNYYWLIYDMVKYLGCILKVNSVHDNERYYTLNEKYYWKPEAFIILDTPELFEKYKLFAVGIYEK